MSADRFWWTGALMLLIGIALVFRVGYAMGQDKARDNRLVERLHEPADNWTFHDRLVMTIAVGMDKSAIITHVRLMDGDKRLKELELRGDTCMANSVKGLPTESGVWECVVEEWGSANLREFRVTESRRVM